MNTLQRRVSPPIEELKTLKQPLTAGEQQVFDFFHSHLDPEWEIYIQPHLNGLRPDFVLLNPNVGIAVFEVKDWNLDAMKYESVEENGAGPILIGRRDNNSFSLQRSNPVEQVYRYKNEIFELYCPRLKQGSGFALITAGIIFPFSSGARVRALLQPCLDFRNMRLGHNTTPWPGPTI